MSVFQDDPTRTTRVLWSRALKDAPELGVPTQFTSSTWDDGLQLPVLGEVRSSRVWRSGTTSRLMQPDGFGLCGSPAQFLNGALTTDPLPPVQPANGFPVCCGPAVDSPCNGVALQLAPCPVGKYSIFGNQFVTKPVAVFVGITNGLSGFQNNHIYDVVEGPPGLFTAVNPAGTAKLLFDLRPPSPVHPLSRLFAPGGQAMLALGRPPTTLPFEAQPYSLLAWTQYNYFGVQTFIVKTTLLGCFQ